MAFFKGSYYEKLAVFSVLEDGSTAFRGVRARPIANPEPVLEHPVATADRLDSTGHHYYSNSRDWRRIADCNADVLFADDLIYDTDPPPRSEPLAQRIGRVLLVPRRREGR